MVRRLFWTTLGATVGIVAVRKLSRTVQAYTPQGVAQGLAGLGEGLREMAAVVREAMAERDAELRLALGVDEGAVEPRSAQALLEQPTADHPRLGAAAEHPRLGSTSGYPRLGAAAAPRAPRR